jgi:hypothetical protein
MRIPIPPEFWDPNTQQSLNACWQHEGFDEPGTYTPQIVESPSPEMLLLRSIIRPDTVNPYQAAERRMAARELYRDLLTDSTIALSDSLADFRDSLALTNDGILERCYMKLAEIPMLDSAASDSLRYLWWDVYAGILEQALQINDSVGGSDPLALREKRVNNILLGREKDHAEATVLQIDDYLASANPDSLLEALYNGEASSVISNQAEDDTLGAVAHSCPLEWGTVVYRCRATMVPDTIPFSHECEFVPVSPAPRYAEKEKQEPLSREVLVYPNPAKDQVNILLPDGHPHRICLFDITGRLLMVEKSNGNKLVQVSLNGIKQGIYLIEVSDQTGNILLKEKVIVQK